jgi:two-component system invasion response regulator UvrY
MAGPTLSSLYLVDDHQLVREGLRALVQAWGHSVVGESACPTHGVADISRLLPDLLLLDLNLGDRSGFELLADLQRRHLTTRSIVLTMSTQPRHVAEALRLGAMGYVLKGSAGSELSNAIDTVLDGRRHLGPEVAELAMQSFTQPQDADPLFALSPRERQIITLVVQGLSSTEIGTLLHLSPKTVATYRSRLMAKLGTPDVPALVRLAVRHKLIDSETTG